MPDLQPIMKSDDVQEGLRAFLERRPGTFEGPLGDILRFATVSAPRTGMLSRFSAGPRSIRA